MAFHSDHQRIDERSIALHRAIVDKVRANPSLLAIAWDNIHRWGQLNPAAVPALKEWEELLNASLNTLLELLTSTSERMTRLRQSSPFAGILTPKERWKIYESFTTGTYYSRSRNDRG